MQFGQVISPPPETSAQWNASAPPEFGSARPYVDIFQPVTNGWGSTYPGRLINPQVFAPKGGAYFVSNSTANGLTVGNDSTGTGSVSSPWLTIDKALTSVPASGDVTIFVNDGTYSESSLGAGRLLLRTVFSDWVSVEPYSGRPNAVIITTTSSSAGAMNCTSSYSCSKIQFRKISIQPGSTEAPAFNVSSSNGSQNSIHLVECCIAGSNGSFFTNTVWFQGDGGFNDFALIGCEFVAPVNSGAQQPAMIAVQPATIAGNGKYTNFYIGGCRTAAGATYQGGSSIFGINGLTVVGNAFTVNYTYGFLVGADASTNAVPFTQNNVYIAGNYFNATAGSNGHGLLMGFGCQSSCVAEHNIVLGGVQGIVVKGASGVVVRRNIVIGTPSTFLNGLYAKASTGTKFLANSVHVLYGDCFREDWDNTTSVTASNTTLVGNRLLADGATATLMTWANAPDSTGGAYADSNVYELRNGASFGTLRSHTLTSFADLQAGWASFGLAGDMAKGDANSQQNVSGSRNDLAFSAPTGQTLYCQLVRSDGLVFNGWAAEPIEDTRLGRSMMALFETATAGTYSGAVPFNLPSGLWTAVVRSISEFIPTESDPILGQVAISYAS